MKSFFDGFNGEPSEHNLNELHDQCLFSDQKVIFQWSPLHEIFSLAFQNVFEFKAILHHELSELFLGAALKDSHYDFLGNRPSDIVVDFGVYISVQKFIHELGDALHELAQRLQSIDLLRDDYIDGILKSCFKGRC